MKIKREIVEGIVPLSPRRPGQTRDLPDPALTALTDRVFADREVIHALIDGARLPALSLRVEAHPGPALRLLDLGGDPSADEVMPWLVELRPNDALTRAILTRDDPASRQALWTSHAVILLRQPLPLDRLHQRFRRHVRIPGNGLRGIFLRFWDAGVMLDLLEAIASENMGFRGPFPPGAILMLPREDALLTITLEPGAEKSDDAPITISDRLRQRLQHAVTRREIENMVQAILAQPPESASPDRKHLARLLERSASMLLQRGWPVASMPPVLRVAAAQDTTPESMPDAARAIIGMEAMGFNARARLLEHEAQLLFGAGPEDEDRWKLR